MIEEELSKMVEVLFKMDHGGQEMTQELKFRYTNRARALASRNIWFVPKQEPEVPLTEADIVTDIVTDNVIIIATDSVYYNCSTQESFNVTLVTASNQYVSTC